MAQNALKPRDSASEYVDIYEDTARRYGIQNARSSAREAHNLNSRPDEDGRNSRPKVSYKGPVETSDSSEEKTKKEKRVAERYYDETNLQENAAANINAGPYNVKITTLDRLTGKVFAYICWSISLWISLLQGFFLTLCLIMLGWIDMTETSWIAWAADEVFRLGSSVFGFEYVDVMPMAVLSASVAVICGLVTAGGFAFFAKSLSLHPFYGNGESVKTGLFIFAIVICIVPLNTAPWIWAVKRYPK